MEPESPFTIRENHPAGATAALAAPLAIVIVWLANTFGANMPVEVGVAIAALLTALPTMLVSWRTPRISIPDIPGAVEDRGIATGPVDLAETVPAKTDEPDTDANAGM